jgi:putative FmdB family regulatory protein
MPTYEYACTECGKHVEVVQSMSDAPLDTCATCGGRLRKVFSPIGIVFKGSGFYRTDSRGKPAKTEPAAADKRDKKPAAETTSTASSPERTSTKPKAAEKSA